MVVRLKSHKNYFKSSDTNNGNNFYLHVQIGEVVCRMNFIVVHTNGYGVLLVLNQCWMLFFLKTFKVNSLLLLFLKKPLNR
jgi:hypothetical protein